MSIKSFRDKKTEALWNTRRSKNFPNSIIKRALQKLDMVNAARSLSDLNAPANNLHRLKGGNLRGYHVIYVTKDEWRISFLWDNEDAEDVWLNNHYGE